MNTEILNIAGLFKDAYNGEPWYGKSICTLLLEVEEPWVHEQPNGQHSIVELIAHIINWRQFAISRLRNDENKLHYFEENDWQKIDRNHKNVWSEKLHQLHHLQTEFMALLNQQNDALLDEPVPERSYTYRKLLQGVLQHDIYHLGQVAYIIKLLKNN